MRLPATTSRFRVDYKVVLEFRVLHDFYAGGRCPDLDIKPTPETQAKLKGCQILFRGERDGFLLAVNSQKDYSAPLFSKPESFDFEFRIPNPHFIRFTNLPYESSQFHFFESSNGFGGRMHSGDFVDATSLHSSDTDGISGLIRILHDADQFLMPTSDGLEAEPTRLHHLHFGTRKVTLRYIFHGTSERVRDFCEYYVESFEACMNGKPSTFSKPRLTTLRNGDEAFEIESQEELEMRSAYDGFGILKKLRGSGTPFIYKKVLPLPKPENVRFDPVSERFFADLFVHL